jgi:hypothetical protein
VPGNLESEGVTHGFASGLMAYMQQQQGQNGGLINIAIVTGGGHGFNFGNDNDNCGPNNG